MSTRRRRYRIAVTRTDEGWCALHRTTDESLPWCWCAHTVRATSNAAARVKAITAHQHGTTCQALDQEVLRLKARLRRPARPG